MSATADAVVVGGGAIGASAAFHLASLGLRRVVLVERRTLASEATGKSAAHVQIGQAPEAQARLALASLPYYLHWDELVGVGSSGFEQTGYLRFGAPGERAEAERRAEAARAMGVEARILDVAELRELAPYLETSDLTWAHYQPLAGHASSTAMTFGFAERARQLGADIRENTAVVGIETDAGRVVGVRTSAGAISTPRVIIAAGAWTPALVRALGLALPATPMRTQVALFTWSQAATPIRMASVNDDLQGCYFSHEGEGARHIVVGLGAPRRTPIADLERYGADGDADYAARARECLVARVPEATYIRPGGGWGGPVTITPDGAPIVDAVPGAAGAVFATGCNGGGLKGSPALGKALAEWAVSGAPRVVDLSPFAASRFTGVLSA